MTEARMAYGDSLLITTITESRAMPTSSAGSWDAHPEVLRTTASASLVDNERAGGRHFPGSLIVGCADYEVR
jgi:hypothetical protein